MKVTPRWLKQEQVMSRLNIVIYKNIFQCVPDFVVGLFPFIFYM